jgi:radical SAM protein with 4Fe4S-binding SPASM domain
MLKYTELKATGRQNLREVLPLRKPFTVIIEPTSHCNFRCVQCFQSIREESYFTRNRTHMPLARFERVIDQLSRWPGPPVKVLKLSLYGEPLAHPAFGDMLRLARAAGVAERIETTTNASLLSLDLARQMIEAPLDYARVSIYATDQARLQAVTGSATKLDTIYENLRALKALKAERGAEKPFVSCKMLDAYGEENERFLRIYGEVADEVYLDKPHSWIQVEGSDFIGNYYQEQAEGARSDLRQHSTSRIACPMAFTTMAVRSNGDVSPCCVDFIGGTNLGNVDDTGLQELWNGEAWFQFQKMQLENRKHENASCARCDIYSSDHYTLDNIDGFPVQQLRPAAP